MLLLWEGVRAVNKFEVDGLGYRDKEIWISQTKRGVGQEYPCIASIKTRTTTATINAIICSIEVL